MAVNMNKLTDGNGILFVLKDLLTKINALLDKKVDKVNGKGLSTNDYTTDEKNKLNGIAAGANKYVHPAYTAKSAGLYKVTVDGSGHVSAATAVTKDDITALGIPGQDTNTTYKPATQSANGLMTAADKAKLDAFGAASGYATTSYVGQQIAAAGHISKKIVTALPAASDAADNVIYLIKKASGSGGNLYDEYMLINGTLELVGDSATKIEVLSNADLEEILAQL